MNRNALLGAAYLSQAKEFCERQRIAREIERRDRSKRLTTAIDQWYTYLPVGERLDRYTMAELVARFKAPASAIGLALHELGWRRKRDWRGDRPYAHFWVIPRVKE